MQTSSTELKNCRGCGRMIEADARFCGACGQRVGGPPPGSGGVQPRSNGPKKKVCPGCQKLNDAAGAFCFDCGVALSEEAVVPLFREPAGFWIRLAACLIDWLVMWAVAAVIEPRLGITSASSIPNSLPPGQQFALLLPSMLLGSLITILYETLMVGAWRGTVGKLLLGLRVVRGDGGRLTYGLSLMRCLAQLISLLPLGLGYLWVGLSPSKRAWHDYLCDTRVMLVAK